LTLTALRLLAAVEVQVLAAPTEVAALALEAVLMEAARVTLAAGEAAQGAVVRAAKGPN